MPKRKRERRRRGEGSVFAVRWADAAKKKPTLWAAELDLGLINGKRKRPRVYAQTEQEAYTALDKLRADHLYGVNIAPDRTTVEAYLTTMWLPHIQKLNALGTYNSYERKVRKHIVSHLGAHLLPRLGSVHIQTMLNALIEQGLSASYVRDVRMCLLGALSTAITWGLLQQNPATKTRVPKVPKRKPKSLSEIQLDRLLEAVRGTRLELLIRVGLGTGMRISEVLALLWSDRNKDQGILSITGAMKYQKHDDGKYRLYRDLPKDGEERTIALAASVNDALDEQWARQQVQRQAAGLAWREQGLVFTTGQGGALNPGTISAQFTEVAERCGFVDISFHSLRHSCVTFLIQQGEHPRVISALLGHSSTKMTERYGDVSNDTTRRAVERLDTRMRRTKEAI